MLNKNSESVCVCVCVLYMKGVPYGSDSKESACHLGDLCLSLGWEDPLERGHGNPLQYSCLENPHGQRSLGSVQCLTLCNPMDYSTPGFPVHHQQNCAHQDPGERSSDPTRDWACEYPGVSSRGMGRQWLAAGSVALNTTVLGTWGHAGISPFEGGLPLPLP